VPIFCYHVVEPAGFEADLRFLRDNGYAALDASAMVGHLDGSAPAPPRSVMLTFDDGPRNFHDVVFPLLRRYSTRAVAFVAPGLHAEHAEPAQGEARPMTWDEIRRIHDSGLVEFQSHTLESRYVPNWPAPAALAGVDPGIENPRRGPAREFADDLAASVALLEQKLPGARVRQLAFPIYIGSEAAIASARALGFEACYWGLTPGRAVNRSGDSPFHASRISDEFLRRLPGSGRISVAGMLSERLRRIRAARAWRSRYHAG
jgi:peptidoglycan/xylan/chitin deacetylase (PgdA/CDA1 family)